MARAWGDKHRCIHSRAIRDRSVKISGARRLASVQESIASTTWSAPPQRYSVAGAAVRISSSRRAGWGRLEAWPLIAGQIGRSAGDEPVLQILQPLDRCLVVLGWLGPGEVLVADVPRHED